MFKQLYIFSAIQIRSKLTAWLETCLRTRTSPVIMIGQEDNGKIQIFTGNKIKPVEVKELLEHAIKVFDQLSKNVN